MTAFALLGLSAGLSVASTPLPVGRVSGEIIGVPSGTLGAPNGHSLLLGNGYVGVTLSTQKAPVPRPDNDSPNERRSPSCQVHDRASAAVDKARPAFDVG